MVTVAGHEFGKKMGIRFEVKTCRRTAFAKVLLPDGQVLEREVVVFDREGHPVSHYPLTREEPFVEWRKETFVYTQLHR